MMKTTTAVTLAIARLRSEGRRISYRNLSEATAAIRGRAVSMRSMRRSPAKDVIEAARGGVASSRPASRPAPDGADELALVRALKENAELRERVRILEAGHRTRRAG